MAGKVKTWVWVIVGVFVVGILCVIAMAAAGIYYFTQNIEARKATPTVAASEFNAVRDRFRGQKPLIELDERGRFLRSNVDRPAPPDAKRPEALYVLAFDPDDEGLVKVTVPFWLLRMKIGNSHVDFGDSRMDLEDLKLTVEDLERFGPTLILDQTNAGGDRVLVWSQ
ncbi:MAG TPA: hypothetical protein VGD94_19170 [Vicinamibacterales bacterium]